MGRPMGRRGVARPQRRRQDCGRWGLGLARRVAAGSSHSGPGQGSGLPSRRAGESRGASAGRGSGRPRTRRVWERGVWCGLSISWDISQTARGPGSPGSPRVSSRSAGCGGVPRAACFPQRVMFGADRAPPVAMETKQGRWRRRSEARLGLEWGEGRRGSRAVASQTGTPPGSPRSSPRVHPGPGLPGVPSAHQSRPRPWPPAFCSSLW